MTSGSNDPPAGNFTLQQVAERLGVHYMTAYRYVRTGQLIATRRDGRWTVTALVQSASDAVEVPMELVTARRSSD